MLFQARTLALTAFILMFVFCEALMWLPAQILWLDLEETKGLNFQRCEYV
jgi:hypothetical protein